MLTSQAIAQLLETNRNDFNSDLFDRVLEYGCNMEIQVNVTPGEDGEPVEGRNSTFTNGLDTWWSFRIPKGAYTNEASWKDLPVQYDLQEHVDAIGLTGWDWKNKLSRWVTFDFDSIAGHAQGVGITDHQLNEVRTSVQNLDYVEVRRSTGGQGLHLYVPLQVETLNHTEHQHLAGFVLRRISEDVGVDLFSRVDVLGGNCWIWASRSSEDKRSFELLKPATSLFDFVPEDWQDTLETVRRKKARVQIEDGKSSVFHKLTSAHRKVSLTDHHKKVRKALAELGCCIWDSGMHLMKTHTKLIEKLFEDPELDMQGVFKTISPGSDLTTPNCFLFPMDEDAWVIYRFGAGTLEHNSWTQDGKGFTSCFINRQPDLKAAASALGGAKTKQGNFSFRNLQDAVKALEAITDDLHIPTEALEHLNESPATLGTSKTGDIFIEVRANGECPDGWNSTDKKGHFTLVTPVKATHNTLTLDYDEKIRALRTPDRNAAGWGIEHQDGSWTRAQRGECKQVLNHYGHADSEANAIMGGCTRNSWTLTSEPFVPELPGDRRWNVNAAQLAYEPVPFDGPEDQHPTWTMILKHVGQGLDVAIRENDWCRESGIITGAQYLLNWVASIFQHPNERLPYLALYGGQNTGKSMFGEALGLLVTRGVTNIDRYLAGSDFNGELEGAIIGVVEERNIGGSQATVNRIKALVTSQTIQIRRMRNDPYTVTNYVNCIQNTNSLDGLPKFDGSDTRITLIEVKPPTSEIPKGELIERLKAEAGFFTHTLLTQHIPATNGRLRVPVVETELKRSTANLNTDPVDLFIEQHCLVGSESSIDLTSFITRMKEVDTSGGNVTKKHVLDVVRKNSAMRVQSGPSGKTLIQGIQLKKGKAKK